MRLFLSLVGFGLIFTTCSAAAADRADDDGSPAQANESTTFVYDALGRLVGTSTNVNPNDVVATSITYDPAGNRTAYTVGGPGGGEPPPPPPPPNQPPVANPNSVTVPKCIYTSVNVVANDTDPEGHYPLTVTAVDQMWAWVENGTNVGMSVPDTNGIYIINYTVTDSLGASSNGRLTVNVAGNQECY